ncbi:unnamed protein product [Rotaria sp. Silwood1]|nr:unnamed protein product [Rotaria sp. Silwood1]
MDYIIQTTCENKKLILLVASEEPFQSLETFLRLRQQFSHIDSVYVFHENETDSTKDVAAPHRIYRNVESLCNHIRELPAVRRRRQERIWNDDFIISSLSRAAVSATDELSSTETTKNIISRQEADFMYSQFLRDILVNLESTEEEMIRFCREKCSGNRADLNAIDEFEEYYEARNAIFWYTRDTFLYRLLNRSLREQDIDTLYGLRYFIKDLHLQLKQRHAKQQQISTTQVLPSTTNNISLEQQTIETVYRGQLMTNEEFDKKIRHNSGGFFSVISFLSTTSHKNLATIYAGNSSTDRASTERSILFQIDIDKTVNKFPYANISLESAFNEEENEILFTMGAVFRIESVDINDDGIWNVKLKLTSEEDTELSQLAEYISEDALSTNPLGSLARLMMDMGKYDKAEKYHLMLLEDPSNTEDFKTLASIYNNLGYIYHNTNRQTKAIEYYENALDIKLKYLPPNDSALASTYNNLAHVYHEQSEYEKALSYYHKALVIDLTAINPKPNNIANRYGNIGSVYLDQQPYSEALKMFEQYLELKEELLPSNHPNLATIYNNISQVYYALKDYDSTNKYLNQTLQIQIDSLPSNHPDLGRTYNNLGLAFYKQGKLKEALEMYEKALKIDRQTLPLHHSTILTIYYHISLIYNSLCDYDTAIEYLNPILQIDTDSISVNLVQLAGIYHNLANAYFCTGQLKDALETNEKSLRIRLKVLPNNHPDLAASYNNISQVYDSLKDYKKAIEYLDRTLQVQINSQPTDYPVLASTYNNLASALYEQCELDEALKLFKKSLEIRLKVLPTNHPDIVISYNNISHVYNSLGLHEESIVHINKSLQIQKNMLPPDHIDFARTYNQLGLV